MRHSSPNNSTSRLRGFFSRMIRVVLRSPLTLIRLLIKLFCAGWRLLRWILRMFNRAARAFFRWFSCGFMLFNYSSKRLFTLRTSAIILLLFVVWTGFVLTTHSAESGDSLKEALRLILPLSLVLSVLLSMNTLPRESEGGTIEVFFSLPVHRYRLLVWHLTTIVIWLTIAVLYQALVLFLLDSQVKIGGIFLNILPATICICLLTVWISTFTRSGPTAGFVSGLVCFLHLFQFRSFGPIMLFHTPFLTGPIAAGPVKWGMGNVALVALLCILLFVQINERLKKSELWFR